MALHTVISNCNYYSVYSYILKYLTILRYSLTEAFLTKESYPSQIAVNILFAVIIGIIYLQLDLGESGLQNR